MKITLITVGSRGDIQPYIPLASGFQDAGYEMTIATHEPYRDFVEEHGLGFAPIATDPRDILSGEDGVEWIETGRNPLGALSKMRELVLPHVMEMAQNMIDACQGADAVLYSTLGFLAGPSLMEKYNIPGMGVYLQPVNPTQDYPFFMMPDYNGLFSQVYNRFSYDAIYTVSGLLFQSVVNQVRMELLDLEPYTENFRHFVQRPFPIAYGYSRHVQPPPPDWDTHLQVSGYWFLDEPDYIPPQAFADWLANGEKPIYIGFGSMTNRNPQETTDIILQAVEEAGVRCVLLSGWAEIGNDNTSDDVYVIDSMPHHWLFPQMSAVIHHGGAGTTAAGLRSGVPSILVPHFVDQPYWGRRVYDLGVSPQPIQRSDLTVEALVRAIKTAVYDMPMRERAKILGEKIRSEDGITNAVQFFQSITAPDSAVNWNDLA